VFFAFKPDFFCFFKLVAIIISFHLVISFLKAISEIKINKAPGPAYESICDSDSKPKNIAQTRQKLSKHHPKALPTMYATISDICLIMVNHLSGLGYICIGK
jgi:hypothetical protein